MILVIGEALIDLIGTADADGKYQAVVGGANANVALALARRGVDQRFMGRLSADGFGQQIRQRLSSNGVNLDYSINASEQTSLAVATIGQDGSASYSFYVDGTADWGWTKDELPSLDLIQELGTNAIQFGGKIYPTTVNPAGTTRTLDTRVLTAQELEQRVFAYADELIGSTSLKPHPTSLGVWYANLSDGTVVNVRSVSSSNASRWTVDIRGSAPDINGLPKYEIKFK